VRDAMTMTSLVKSMMLRQSSTLEVVPIIRAGCMALSVTDETYRTDPIYLRFARKVLNNTNGSLVIQRLPDWNPTDWKVSAVPIILRARVILYIEISTLSFYLQSEFANLCGTRTQHSTLFPYHLIFTFETVLYTRQWKSYGRINSFEGLKHYSTKTSFAQ